MATRIPLEDNFDDIIGKASRGLKIPIGVMPAASDEAALRQIASRLQLGAEALVASARQEWYPVNPGSIEGLVCFTAPYADMTVNSFVVFDPQTKVAAAFDTGTDCSGMLALPVKIQQIFITHIHGDHIGDLARLKDVTGAKAFVSEREPIVGAETFADGKVFSIGSLKVETRRTSGHTRGGVTYVVTGLSKRLAFTGDAMFAGSMGRGMANYREALETNRTSILSLPDDTVICPGHGPLSTVGEEKLHNPFFAV